MIINTNVPKSVYDALHKGQIVKAKTNFDNPYSPKAYKLLSEVSHMKNFFFGIVSASEDREDLEIHLTGSNPNNDTILTLDIPENVLFVHDFYSFSGLIYDCEDYDNLQLPNETLRDYAKGLHIIEKDSTVQVIFEEIRPEWLLSAETLQAFDFHDTPESLNAQKIWQENSRFKKETQK